MLYDLQNLDEFLDSVYSAAPCKVSVKTRLGIDSPAEFDAIMNVYRRYPISELIIHPRVRKDFYRHSVRKEAFDKAYGAAFCPISYNGSIITPQDYEACSSEHPNLHSIMIGQGLVSDPFLAAKIRFGTVGDVRVLQEFHDRLFDGYAAQFQSKNNAASRMKELWFYLGCSFKDSEPHVKKLLKSKSAEDYPIIAHRIFHEAQLLLCSTGNW